MRARATAPGSKDPGLHCACALAAALFIIAALPLSAQQTPPRDSTKTVTTVAGTAVLGGVVTNDDGSRPVRFAYVVLVGTGTGTVKVSSTDSDGRFSFTGLSADRYTVGVSKPPYLGTVAGAKRPARSGTPIAIADGQKFSNIAIRMPMGASITGVITDERGQPGTGVAVSLLQWRMQSGERALGPTPGINGSAVTDDRGRYRFFGLPPGEYVVAAIRLAAPASVLRTLSAAEVDAAMKTGVMPPPPPPPPQVRYAPVYYPGTTRPADAQPILVIAGDERINIDLRLETVQTVRVDGVVTSSDGQPVTRAQVMITSAVGSLLSTASAITVGPDGRFSMSGLPPGTHVFSVNRGEAGQYARAVVEIAGGTAVSVQLTLQPAMSFTGRLMFEGATPAPSVLGRRIPLRALAGGAGAVTPQMSATDQKGAFTVTNVAPGRYLLGGPLSFGPTADTMTWSLQSVIVDGRDVTDLPIEITNEPPKDVLVTYGDRFQELSGRLQSQSGAPVSDYTMVVFPEDRAYWIQGSRRIVIARPGTDGRFTLSGPGPTTLPPGRYLLAAVTDINRDEQFDPAFLAQLVPAAVPITLAPGEKKIQDLAIK